MVAMKRFVAEAAVLSLSAALAGCSSGGGGLGGIGGQMLGNVAGNMLTHGAQNQAQQQQQAVQQQQGVASAGADPQQAAAQVPSYKAPAMDMSGKLVEKKAADGSSAGWSLMQEGGAGGLVVDVSKVESEARALAGKSVIVTGRYDTMGSGNFVAEKITVAGQ